MLEIYTNKETRTAGFIKKKNLLVESDNLGKTVVNLEVRQRQLALMVKELECLRHNKTGQNEEVC